MASASTLQPVKDWGGFEQFVAELNKTGDVTVERNVVLTGTKGVARQIDVLITHKKGLYTHRILVECKYWRGKIKRMHVDAMTAAVADLAADKGVFFTTQGCQKGAAEMAKRSNISIFKVRDLEESEWGAPGRNIHLRLQFFSREGIRLHEGTQQQLNFLSPSVYPPDTHPQSDKSAIRAPRPNETLTNFDIVLGGGTETRLYAIDGSAPMKTLESVLEQTSLDLLRRVYEATPGTVLPEDKPVVRHEYPLNIAFNPHRVVPAGNGFYILTELKMHMQVKWEQIDFRFDRMSPYIFTAIVEDCVNNTKVLASRRTDEEVTKLDDMAMKTEPDDRIQNGMIVKTLTSTWAGPVMPTQK